MVFAILCVITLSVFATAYILISTIVKIWAIALVAWVSRDLPISIKIILTLALFYCNIINILFCDIDMLNKYIKEIQIYCETL